MSGWQIHLPHRGDLDAPIVEAAHVAGSLPTDDALVTRQIVLDWAGDVRTVGEGLQRLQEMVPAERRLLLDHARVEAGLPSIDDVERAERARAPLAVGPAPVEPTARLVPLEGGGYTEVPLVEPRPVRTPGGGITDASVVEADDARQREVEDSDRRQRLARAADAARGAEEMRNLETARRDQLRSELPDYLKETA